MYVRIGEQAMALWCLVTCDGRPVPADWTAAHEEDGWVEYCPRDAQGHLQLDATGTEALRAWLAGQVRIRLREDAPPEAVQAYLAARESHP